MRRRRAHAWEATGGARREVRDGRRATGGARREVRDGRCATGGARREVRARNGGAWADGRDRRERGQVRHGEATPPRSALRLMQSAFFFMSTWVRRRGGCDDAARRETAGRPARAFTVLTTAPSGSSSVPHLPHKEGDQHGAMPRARRRHVRSQGGCRTSRTPRQGTGRTARPRRTSRPPPPATPRRPPRASTFARAARAARRAARRRHRRRLPPPAHPHPCPPLASCEAWRRVWAARSRARASCRSRCRRRRSLQRTRGASRTGSLATRRACESRFYVRA